MTKRAVFLDKDGTLVEDVPYNVDPEKIRLMEGVAGLQKLTRNGYLLIVMSNQSGVARGYFSEATLALVEQQLRELLAQLDIPLHDFYYCPHYPEGSVAEYATTCNCRKPAPGLLLQAARDYDIDLSQSWFIGDILNDVEAGRRAGCRTILLDNGNETEWLFSPWRIPHYKAASLTDAAGIITSADQLSPTLQLQS
jgi:D-glycero-D-manno-heptose 1,7-bisphosphate phosphatase